MGIAKIILTVIQVLAAIVLTAMVLFQSGKSAGLAGAIGGGSDTFFSKNKAKRLDSLLAKATKYVAIGFMLLTLVLCLFL